MKIGGLQKFSLIDYPGKISAVIFVQGCNFRCPYCYNRDLVLPEYFSPEIPEADLLEFLEGRKGKIQGVVITGGEPTIFPDLPEFLRKIKTLGFQIKLDTNGSNPEMLELLIKENLIDYLAMDIKAPLEKYPEITNFQISKDTLLRSIEIINSSDIPYEFRTTVIKDLLNQIDILKISNLIKGSKRYALQNFHPSERLIENSFKNKKGLSEEEILNLKKRLEDKFGEIIIRT